MRIDEFQQTSILPLKDLVSALDAKLDLAQVGGSKRVFEVGSNRGLIFLVNGSRKGLGVVFTNDGNVVRVATWDKLDLDSPPSRECDIPSDASLQDILGELIGFVQTSSLTEAEEIENGDFEVHLMARKGKDLYRLPGMEQIEAKLRSAAMANITKTGSPSMEKQYEALEGKVKLVAGSKSSFIRSLLITGAPSTGKTFRVMQTVKELGLSQGKDYITKKGKISAKSLYRVLIEQLRGLAIFDDCDSVVEDPNGVNMLKGALDTDPVRTVDYDVQGLLNTGAMSFERRGEIVLAMSSILRGVATKPELETIEALMPAKEKVVDSGNVQQDIEPEMREVTDEDGYTRHEFVDLDAHYAKLDSGSVSMERMAACERWVMRNLPNKIDFEGRIIFISNLSEEEWDSAIITRALHQDLHFGSGEMLDFIRTIKKSIKTTNLSEDEKTEVLDYVQELFDAGRISTQINFRFIMKCFDFYIMKSEGYDWKALVAEIG